MGVSLLSISFIHLLLSSTQQLLSTADNTLGVGVPLHQNQTITSNGGTFELGFFSPGNSSSSSRYVGIWYKNDTAAQKTVVWVANREKPLADSAGVLRIVEDGNIALLDGEGSILWSSNLTSVRRNITSAVLLNSGNLVLRDGENNAIWQSFDHPTDNLLPSMEIALDHEGNSEWKLVSWRNDRDPFPGRFSFGADSRCPLQLVIRNGSRTIWRSRPWDGRQIFSQADNNSSSLLIQFITLSRRRISLIYTATRQLEMSRLVLHSNGYINYLYWNSQARNWTELASLPRNPCDPYDRCGPYGVCDSNSSSLCQCLEGFEPNDRVAWGRGNFTRGCKRIQPLNCDTTNDQFLVSGSVKLPDNFSIHWNITSMECQARCRSDCSCSAYAYADIRTDVLTTGSRCLTWVGELIDLRRLAILGEDIYVRHAAIETDASATSDKRNVTRIAVPSVVAGVLLGGAFCYFLWRRLKRRASRGLLYDEKRFSEMLGSEKNVSEVPLLDFSAVAAATHNFASANMLGRGGFGPVYKGTLFQGQEIAVKRLSKGSGQGFKEFENEVKLIAKLQHTNLVRLLGWCSHEDEKILIYEYLPNGSLDKFLFDERMSAILGWEKRFKIIEGIANGILYLHRYSRLRIIHRDLKASNILLDEYMNPKISDFGLAKIFGGNQTEANTENIIGTYGYMSPEYAMGGLFSEKSDVFSFGVLLLEIITGKRNTGFFPYKESLNLVEFVWHMWDEGRALELLDPSAGGISDALEVTNCIQVGLLCVQDGAAERPTMSSVVFMLRKENNASLPSPKKSAFVTTNFNSPLTPSQPFTESSTDQ